MSDDLDRQRIKRALREAGVRPEGLPLIYSCPHCDSRFPTIPARKRHLNFSHPQLKVVR